MSKINKRNRTFKDQFCAHCELADRKEMRQGRPHYCSHTKKTGKEPEMRNGHCVPMLPIKKSRKKKEEATVG